jgi:hypothetical protein
MNDFIDVESYYLCYLFIQSTPRANGAKKLLPKSRITSLFNHKVSKNDVIYDGILGGFYV